MTEEEKRKYQPPPTLGNKQEPPENPELKRKILRSKIKQLGNVESSFTGEETMNWLIKMEDETIIPGSLMLDGSQFSMPDLMDVLFDSLERYSFEINKRKQHLIQCQRPSGYKEKVDHFHRRKIKYIRAHLSSDQFSMVFHATDTSVAVYFIPTDFLVGFDPYESEFQPYVCIDKLSVQEISSWGIERKKLCRRLIGQLIKVIEGQSKAEDKFTFSTSDDDNDEDEFAFIDRTFEEDDEGLHAGEQLPTALQPKYLEKQRAEGQAGKSDEATQSRNSSTFAKPELPHREEKEAIITPPPPPEPAAPPPPPAAPAKSDEADNASSFFASSIEEEKEIEQAPLPEDSIVSKPQGVPLDVGIRKQVDDAQQTVMDACGVVVSGINDALDSLHETGVSAMKNDEVDRVNEVMSQSRRLKSIKEKLSKVIDEISKI